MLDLSKADCQFIVDLYGCENSKSNSKYYLKPRFFLMILERGASRGQKWIMNTLSNVNRVEKTSEKEVRAEFITPASRALHSHQGCGVK